MIDPVKLREQRARFGRRPYVRTGNPLRKAKFPCLLCGEGPLSFPNKTGLCNACWPGFRKATLDRFRALHNERAAAWLRQNEQGRAA